MDLTVIYSGLGDLVALGATTIAAVAARQSKKSSDKANQAAGALADIEQDRRHTELTPRFRARVEPWTAGNDQDLRLRVTLTGPTGLDRIDGLTVKIRDDHFKRGEAALTAGGPTREEIKAQVWGPYRFRPGTGPDDSHADPDGRVTVYDAELPIGEELPYLLERTRPPAWAAWMTQEQWNEQRGPVIRIALEAWHNDHGKWILPCEIDLSADHDPRYAGWLVDVPQA
jgi:hypothetical protein